MDLRPPFPILPCLLRPLLGTGGGASDAEREEWHVRTGGMSKAVDVASLTFTQWTWLNVSSSWSPLEGKIERDLCFIGFVRSAVS